MDASTDEEDYEYDADAVDTSDDYEMYEEEDTSHDQEDILGDDLLFIHSLIDTSDKDDTELEEEEWDIIDLSPSPFRSPYTYH